MRRSMIVALCGIWFSTAVWAQGHLKYFGYVAGADTYADLTQTFSFTNFAVTNAQCGSCSQTLPARVNAMVAQGVRALLSVDNVLFSEQPVGSGQWHLRTDYATSWSSFVSANRSILDTTHLVGFYIVDEPTNRNISASDLATATNLVKNTFPTIPTSTVEAYSKVDGLTIPSSMDWIGIDEYGLRDPATDSTYQTSLSKLKAKLTAAQKIIYVLDGWWASNLQGANGLTPDDMACVASKWYSLAANDPQAVLLAVFLWPSGTDSTGTEDLPEKVRTIHIGIGTTITSKAVLYTMLTRQVPTQNLTGTVPYEDGTQFTSSRSGIITALRFYKASGETGTHVGRIWDDATGNLLASVTFTGEGASGWQAQNLPTPLSISAGRVYRVSYNFNTHLSKTLNGLSSPILNGPLAAKQGFYTTPAGSFPTTSSPSNFFADFFFHPTDSPPAIVCGR